MTGKKVACPSSRGHAQKTGKCLAIGAIDKRSINERLVICRGMAGAEKLPARSSASRQYHGK